MALKFKEGALPTDLKERVAYLYRLNELLRLYFNEIGKKFKLKQLTKEEFDNFTTDWYMARSYLIHSEINKCKEKFKVDTTIKVNVTDIEEEE